MQIVIAPTGIESSQAQAKPRLSLRDRIRSYGGSLLFHVVLLLLPISWIISTQTSAPDPYVTITTGDSDLGALEPLNEAHVEMEFPDEPTQDPVKTESILALFLKDEFDLPLNLRPVLTQPDSGRNESPSKGKRKQIDAVKSALEKEVRQRVTRAGGKSGAIQISLIWNNGNDLDVYVKTPVGDIIAFAYKRSRCGGELDVDMNARKTESLKPVENVFWSAKLAPRGVFVVGVNEYQNHGFRDPTPFVVSVNVDGEVHHFRGSTRSGRPVQGVCKFERTANGVKFLKTPATMAGNKSGKKVLK